MKTENGHIIFMANGEEFYLTNSPVYNKHSFQNFSSKHPCFPREAWQPKNKINLQINDQLDSYAGNAFSAARQYAIAHIKAGYEKTDFSPWGIYALSNGGFDNGVHPLNLMITLATNVPLDKDVPEWTYRASQLTAEAKANAKNHKTSETFYLTTFDEIAVALMLDYAVGVNIDIGVRYHPKNGFLPDHKGHYGTQYLAIEGMLYSKDQWWLIAPNNFSAKWGDNGYAYIPESYFKNFDGYAIKVK